LAGEVISNQLAARILVVDDFAPWLDFVLGKLRENHNLCVIGVASDGLEAVLKTEALQPDLILLDIGLPKLNGIEAARRIRNTAPESKILFLSQESELDVVRAALSAGGHGYVVKSDAEDDLITAMEAVMKGKRYLSRKLAGHSFGNAGDLRAAGQLPPR
jgi:DNA-binding NarL/FixJ family response regulator